MTEEVVRRRRGTPVSQGRRHMQRVLALANQCASANPRDVAFLLLVASGASCGDGTGPAPVRFSTIMTSNTVTCAISTVRDLYCWGYNDFGQLGTGDFDHRSSPTLVPGGLKFTGVTAGSQHTCGLTQNGAVYCWGRNTTGAVGIGSTSLREPNPTRVSSGLPFTAIDAGETFSCALAFGKAYCWGSSPGTGASFTLTSPTLVAGVTGLVSIGAGLAHTCALHWTGKAWCWGLNASGQLGDSSNTSGLVPVAVAGGLSFDTLDVGRFHTCGLRGGLTAARAYCWGASHRPGGGTHPLPVGGGLRFVAIAADGDHTCGIASDYSAYCWGGNLSVPPLPVAGGLGFRQISAGGGATCGISRDGVAYCWTGVSIPIPVERPD